MSNTTSSRGKSVIQKKGPAFSPSNGQHRLGLQAWRSGRVQADGVRNGDYSDFTNREACNLPDDWGVEKEVTEEKQVSAGKPDACTVPGTWLERSTSPQADQ